MFVSVLSGGCCDPSRFDLAHMDVTQLTNLLQICHRCAGRPQSAHQRGENDNHDLYCSYTGIKVLRVFPEFRVLNPPKNIDFSKYCFPSVVIFLRSSGPEYPLYWVGKFLGFFEESHFHPCVYLSAPFALTHFYCVFSTTQKICQCIWTLFDAFPRREKLT